MPDTQIYIVDDDEAVRDSLALLLGFRGWRTRVFPGAEEFLGDWRPEWRGCLLLDLRLGGMDGLSLQHALAERGSRLPIVFLTGHGDVAQARQALKGGAVDFLEKPYTEEALLDAINEALARDARDQARQERDAEIEARLARLTERERQVMDLVVMGKPNRDIAVELDISPRTVEVFKARMMEKMQARSVPELVRLVLEGTGDAP
jgi:RNA polymerase sigma factor (sigma-70 family)